MANIRRLNSMSEVLPKDVSRPNFEPKNDLNDLKLFLKHLNHTFKHQKKWQKIFVLKTKRFKRKLKRDIKTEMKLENKLNKEKKSMRKLLKSSKARREAKLLKQQRFLRHLKEMSKVRKSLRKIYYKELKAQKRRQYRTKMLEKRETLKLKKIRQKIVNLAERLEDLEENIKERKLKIVYFKQKSESIDLRGLRKKIKQVKNKILALKRIGRPQPANQKGPFTKLVERSKQIKLKEEKGDSSVSLKSYAGLKRRKLKLTTSTSGYSKRSLKEIKSETCDLSKRKRRKKLGKGTEKDLSSSTLQFGRTSDLVTDLESFLSKKPKRKSKIKYFERRSQQLEFKGTDLSSPKHTLGRNSEPIEKQQIRKSLSDSTIQKTKDSSSDNYNKRSGKTKNLNKIKEKLKLLHDQEIRKSNISPVRKLSHRSLKDQLKKFLSDSDKPNSEHDLIKKRKYLDPRILELSQTKLDKSLNQVFKEIKSNKSKDKIRAKKIKSNLKKLKGKFQEPLPIGDKVDQDLSLKITSKRKSFRKRERASEGDFKTPTTTTTSAESEAPGLEAKTSLNEVEQYEHFKTERLKEVPEDQPSAPESNVTRKARDKRLSLSINQMRTKYNQIKKKLIVNLDKQADKYSPLKINVYGISAAEKPSKLKPDFFRKPIDKRILKSVSMSTEKQSESQINKDPKRVSLVIKEDEENNIEEHLGEEELESKPQIMLRNIRGKQIIDTLPIEPPIPRISALKQRRSTIEREKHFKQFYQTQISAITNKLEEQRKRQQELDKQAKEKLERVEKPLSRRRSSQSESVKLDKLFKKGLKSTYNLINVVPEDTPIIDDNILKISHRNHRIRVSNMFARASSIKSSPIQLKFETPFHQSFKSKYSLDTTETTQPTASSDSSSTSSLQKIKPKAHKIIESFKGLKANEEQEVMPEEEQEEHPEVLSVIASGEELESEVRASDLLRKALAQKLAEKLNLEKRPKKIKVHKKKESLEEETQVSKERVLEEEGLKVVCSSCGMTNMQPGGPCCSLVSKDKCCL